MCVKGGEQLSQMCKALLLGGSPTLCSLESYEHCMG